MGLRRVLEQQQAPTVREGPELAQIHWLAIQMHYDHGRCARADRSFNGLRSHQRGMWITVDQDGRRADLGDRLDGGDERHRRGYHLVAASHAGDPERQSQRVRSTRAAHAVCEDRKSTRLNSSHGYISYAVFCLKKKINT